MKMPGSSDQKSSFAFGIERQGNVYTLRADGREDAEVTSDSPETALAWAVENGYKLKSYETMRSYTGNCAMYWGHYDYTDYRTGVLVTQPQF